MTHDERQEWATRRKNFVVGGPCARCGGLAHDCHEILAGANRQAAWVERACWLRLCRTCHDEVQGAEVEYQLALKLLSDPEGFDLRAFCKAWGRAETAVTAREILRYVRIVLLNRGIQR